MRLKTAKKGSNAGGQFWSCVKFPKCRGARDFINDRPGSAVQSTRHWDADSEERPTLRPTNMTIPVYWTEGEPRTKFNYEYLSIGSVPGVIREIVGDHQTLKRLFSHTLLLWSKGHKQGKMSEHARITSALLAKLLQRGHIPLSTLEIEHTALNNHKLIDKVEDLADDKVEVGWQLKSELKKKDCYSELVGEWIKKERFTLAEEAKHSLSDNEVEFLTKWVPSNLGESAGHWFIPQAPLDTLLESAMLDENGARRIDFLACHPGGGRPLAIEIDGPEHLSAQEIDFSRDRSLRSMGIDVVRVSNQEVRDGKGPQLEKIQCRFKKWENRFQPASSKGDIGRLAADCSIATKIQFVIARAISLGWLTGEEWKIELSGVTRVGKAGVLDALRLLTCFDILYGQQSAPKLCTVRVIGGSSITWKLVDGRWEEEHGKEAESDRITIVVEHTSSPFHAIEYDADAPDFIIRPAFLPVPLAVEPLNDILQRVISPSSYETVRPALREFLRNIFRKYDFWPRQDEAIFNCLCHKDSVVLLPTGAGKSIIYQLTGLLMPGITIVVDPIIALIEDQVEGLQEYGIDRAVGIVSSIDGRRDRDRLLRQIERGEYQFVLHSPERLQSPKFRGTLNAIREKFLVNLAVIDEAHCVSEWGHDFRPAYLNLANNLRRLGENHEGTSPPLLALTGTASRAVLRDVLTDLGIDRSNSRALIRPESFDRKELNFEIKQVRTTGKAQAVLRGTLNAMPGKFGMRRAQFYTPDKRNTASGIIFTRTVKSPKMGLNVTRKLVRMATKAQVTIYSGDPPHQIDRTGWDREKRSNANAFKHNEVPLLVATSAFGMGIDKPNIRYIVHFGMPGSLESFYQEVGRAGRDRKRALCVMIFTEYDQKRSDSLIDPNIDLSELHQRFTKENKNRSIWDDVTSAIYFHLDAFAGSEREVEDIKGILNRIDLESPDRCELTWMDERDRRRKEHAIIRLLKLSVIRDYQIERGSRKLIVDSEHFNFDRCRKKLLGYIRAAQPARAKAFEEQLDGTLPGNPRENALNFAKQLIEFTYDVIERSRRRMIQESVLLARECIKDKEIRVRLLDYLQEGLSSERIRGLLEQEKVQFEEILKLLKQVKTPIDAGELRGLCARLLESYPDHPGLLLCRAVAEAMCSDCNDSVSWQGISSAITMAAGEKYRVQKQDIEMVISSLYDLAQIAELAGKLGILLTWALLQIAATDSAFGYYCVAIATRRATELKDQEKIEIIFCAYDLEQAVQDSNAVTKLITERYTHPKIAQFL